MSKPANKKVIGVFILGAIALLVGALLIFGSGKIFKKTHPVVFYFEGSVKGLNIGSAVMFRGVQVGSVTDVVLRFNAQARSFQIPVFAEFDPAKVEKVSGRRLSDEERLAGFKMLIDQGLRAQLEMQSLLTGLLMINLDFKPDTPIRLVGGDTNYLEIPTIPATLEELSEKLRKLPIEEIFNKLSNSLEQFNKVISSPEVERGIKDIGQGVKEVRTLVKNINNEIKPLSTSIQDTLNEARILIEGVDYLAQNVDRQVEPITSRIEENLDATRKFVEDVNAEVAPLSSSIQKTLEEARISIGHAQRVLQAAEGNYAEGSAFHYELTETLADMKEASRSINLLGEYLKRHPDSILWGKGKPGGK